MKFTIGRKLGLGFSTVLALLIISSGLVYVKSREIKEIETAVERRAATEKALIALQRELNQTQSKGRQIVLAGTEQIRREAAQKLFDSVPGTTISKRTSPRSTNWRRNGAFKKTVTGGQTPRKCSQNFGWLRRQRWMLRSARILILWSKEETISRIRPRL